MERLGLKTGDVLAFLTDPSITCTVAGPSAVTFRGQQMSPSAAALQAIREMGYDWTSISGSEYWDLQRREAVGDGQQTDALASPCIGRATAARRPIRLSL